MKERRDSHFPGAHLCRLPVFQALRAARLSSDSPKSPCVLEIKSSLGSHQRLPREGFVKIHGWVSFRISEPAGLPFCQVPS